MSLELAIQQNTAAINTLIEILSKGAIPAPAAEEAQPEQPKAPAKKAKKEAVPIEQAEPETAPVQQEEPAAEEPVKEAVEAKPPTYTETAALVTKVANLKGRAVAVDLLAKFGVKTLNEVKASKYAEVIAACEAVLS